MDPDSEKIKIDYDPLSSQGFGHPQPIPKNLGRIFMNSLAVAVK